LPQDSNIATSPNIDISDATKGGETEKCFFLLGSFEKLAPSTIPPIQLQPRKFVSRVRESISAMTICDRPDVLDVNAEVVVQ
jgi:hypothetical protein